MNPVLKFVVCMAVSSAAICAEPAQPIRILPIGDSITQGGRRGRDEWTYRWPLFCMLKDAGIAADFIGTRNKGLDGDVTWPEYKGAPFDADHEGYYGAKTAFVRDQLKTNLPKIQPPDFALIHLGTNDQAPETFADTIVKPLEDIVALLRARNPKVVVLIAHLNFNGGAALKIRPLVEEMAKRVSTTDSPVVTVAQYEGWKEDPKDPATDTFDWAHPNPQGQKKMAEKWLAAMKPYLNRAKP